VKPEGFWIDPAEGHRRFLRRGDADGRAGRPRARLHRRVRHSDEGRLTPTGVTSSTASTTASKRPVSAFPRQARRPELRAAGAGQRGGPFVDARWRRATARPALLTPSGPITYAEPSAPDRSRRPRAGRGGWSPSSAWPCPLRRPRVGRDLLRRAEAGRGGGPAEHATRRGPLRTVLADCRPKAVVTDPAGLAAAGVDAPTLGPARLPRHRDRRARRAAGARAGGRRRDGILASTPRARLAAEGGGALPPHAPPATTTWTSWA
jgi:hypothetical protein